MTFRQLNTHAIGCLLAQRIVTAGVRAEMVLRATDPSWARGVSGRDGARGHGDWHRTKTPIIKYAHSPESGECAYLFGWPWLWPDRAVDV